MNQNGVILWLHTSVVPRCFRRMSPVCPGELHAEEGLVGEGDCHKEIGIVAGPLSATTGVSHSPGYLDSGV